MARPSEITELLLDLAAVFRLPPELDIDRAAHQWAIALGDLPIEALRGAAAQYTRSGKHWPMPSEIRRLALTLVAPGSIDAPCEVCGAAPGPIADPRSTCGRLTWGIEHDEDKHRGAAA